MTNLCLRGTTILYFRIHWAKFLPQTQLPLTSTDTVHARLSEILTLTAKMHQLVQLISAAFSCF